ncbi:MAG TPA: TonB-dependent receptor [Terriglobales bacterium]|nr:TonB-dependent receptor [Terriglobales bacterium]
MKSRISLSRRILPWFLLALTTAMIATQVAAGQATTATATLHGTVRDPSGAVVAGATITVANVETGAKWETQSNSTGNYSLVSIAPGKYTAQVAKVGFITEKLEAVVLEVNQTATINFNLRVGSTNTIVNVSTAGLEIESSTAELGNVITTSEVNALPLNGRNFTELLLLAPGVSPANQSQNAGFGGIGNPLGTVVLPAVNGQTNRSNMFLLDGVNNYGSIRDTYGVQPTLDDIQEFKVQSHNDEAEFGQVLGGIVNLVTKSGTNQYHGDAWEFLRNDAFDAANYFNPVKIPLKQNQFGGAVGGPVILPRYNGRNKTFLYFSYEGFRSHSSANNLFLTPTAAQLNGDFSNLESQGVQLFNPYSSVPDAATATGYFRQPFMCDSTGNALAANAMGIQANGTACDKLPSSLLNSTMVYYAKTLFPAPINTGNPSFNGRDTTPSIVRQDQISVRGDEQIGEKDRIFARYTAAWQPDSVTGGFPGLLAVTQSNNYNIAASWTHTFGPSSLWQFTFGRVSAQFNGIPAFTNAPANFLQQSGFAPAFYNHLNLGPLIPSIFVTGYLGGSTYVGKLHYSNVWEYRGDISKTSGRHTFRMGGSLATDGWTQPFYGSQNNFDPPQTADGNGNGGDALASMMLGVPSYAEVDNVYSLLHGGKIIGGYFQDQWRVNDRLTLNLGLRYDVTINPRQGEASNGSNITGNFDFNNGTYVLQDPAPACSATQGAPCIPGGVLPAHVVIAKSGKVVTDNYDNVQPRIGFAYRLTTRTVMRGGYGRFFDNWAGVTQNQSNYTQSWPNVSFVAAPNNLNIGPATAFANDPLHLGNGPIQPPSTPFSPLNVNYYTNPNLKAAYADQWNFGFQREMAANVTATINYVGSHDSRLPDVLTANAAPTPEPGNPQLRAPYPYILPMPYYQNLAVSSYNALQLSSQIRSRGGLSSTLAYTWSKALNNGCDGYFSICDIQDPYNVSRDRGPATFDSTNIFAASFMYQLPFGAGKRFSSGSAWVNHIIGNWQINGIATLSSGLRYDVQTYNPSISNTNNLYGSERANLVGDPYLNVTRTNPINVQAFAIPAPFTFGDMGRNSLVSDWNKDLDVSFFRAFPISESKRFEFRAEAFNVTNTPVFAIPDNGISDPTFGVVSSTANTARELQLALKFYF